MKKLIAVVLCCALSSVILYAQVGIGTLTPSKMAKLTVIGEGTYDKYPVYQAGIIADSATSANATGVYGNGGWRGVYGRNNGTAAGTEAIGVLAELADGGAYTGTGYGLKATANGTGPKNYGVYVQAGGATGDNWGVYSTATTAGVYGICIGAGKAITPTIAVSSAGIAGQTPTSSVGLARPVGVFGSARTASNVAQDGVVAIAESGSFINAGIEAFAIGAPGSTNYGVYGSASGGSTNYAGYFSGPIYATGASAGVKSFKIDHPLDPENKYLLHSSVESKDMMDIYNGIITTDINGDATVVLPTYFDALNKECKYQLTCIGDFAQAIVKEEEKNNSFKIKTDKPNIKVSWQITGIRHDPTALKYPIVDEINKPASEKGFYLVPEAYGLSQQHNAAFLHSAANSIATPQPLPAKKVEPAPLIQNGKGPNEN